MSKFKKEQPIETVKNSECLRFIEEEYFVKNRLKIHWPHLTPFSTLNMLLKRMKRFRLQTHSFLVFHHTTEVGPIRAAIGDAGVCFGQQVQADARITVENDQKR